METLNGKVLDGVGLGLSVAATVSPQGLAIDVIQGDPYGAGIGAGAILFHQSPVAAGLDISYGIWQVIK